jgi:hypothetical protein
MRPLKALREGWDEIEGEERRLEQDTTVEENVAIFLSLCEIAAPHLAATEEMFRPAREAELIEFQSRLQQLDNWRRQHRGPAGKPV